MKIFNSLGSNYDWDFVKESLLTINDSNNNIKLKQLLEEKYHGTAYLFYKGRQAIEAGLEVLGLSKYAEVLINGFTCFAVFEAIEKAGFKPVCMDIDEGDLNFSAESLLNKLNQNPKIKTVIIQNTLGFPTQGEAIAKICKDKNIYLIEDLAHCVSAKYSNGKEAGTLGDITILSFSQDKIIDSVSGGALVIRNKKFQNNVFKENEELNLSQQLRDRYYPFLAFVIRKTYPLGIGKPLHFLLKLLNILSKPSEHGFYKKNNLPNWYCELAVSCFENLDKNLTHRKRIALLYKENLDKKILSNILTSQISHSANLRFPIFIDNRESLIKYLKRQGIFVSDIWYDDVSPDCPNAVDASRKILNLPTHINVSESNAKMICERINEWLKSQ